MVAGAMTDRWTRLRRRIECDVLGWHVGAINVVSVDAPEASYLLHYQRCTRCGRLNPLDMIPKHEGLQERLAGTRGPPR